MNIWKRILAGGALCAVALGLAAPAFAETIRLGLMCPLTGKWASEGQDMKNIVSLLVDETNARRRHQRQEGRARGGRRTPAIRARRRWRPRSLPGPAWSPSSAPTAPPVTEASPEHHRRGRPRACGGRAPPASASPKRACRSFSRTCPRDDAQGAAAAEAIVKGGFKKVALLHDKSSYAKGLADESRKALEKAGVEIVLLRRSDAR